MKRSARLRPVLLAGTLASTTAALALDTSAIVASVASPDCLQYRVVGICYWLYCTLGGCSVRTSLKVRHYVPDAVVASYSNTGENPWHALRALSPATAMARSGGAGTSAEVHENNLALFKNADVIGHPGAAALAQYADQFGYTCGGAGTPFKPYLLSTLDTLAWRYGVPERAYPEAVSPGLREIGSRAQAKLWGTVYPRTGFVHQADDYKGAAVIAQRAGDIVTREGQPHVYQPLRAQPQPGYWPAGPLKEGDAQTGRWQPLAPRLSSTCVVFPHDQAEPQAPQGDYAWALWRPYACCERQGQVLLGSQDFM